MGLGLAVCGGGDDTAALIVALIVLVAWLSMAATLVRGPTLKNGRSSSSCSSWR